MRKGSTTGFTNAQKTFKVYMLTVNSKLSCMFPKHGLNAASRIYFQLQSLECHLFNVKGPLSRARWAINAVAGRAEHYRIWRQFPCRHGALVTAGASRVSNKSGWLRRPACVTLRPPFSKILEHLPLRSTRIQPQ